MESVLNKPPRLEPTPFWMWKLRLQTSSFSTGPSQYEHPGWKVPNQLLGSPPPWHCYLLPTAGDQRPETQRPERSRGHQRPRVPGPLYAPASPRGPEVFPASLVAGREGAESSPSDTVTQPRGGCPTLPAAFLCERCLIISDRVQPRHLFISGEGPFRLSITVTGSTFLEVHFPIIMETGWGHQISSDMQPRQRPSWGFMRHQTTAA